MLYRCVPKPRDVSTIFSIALFSLFAGALLVSMLCAETVLAVETVDAGIYEAHIQTTSDGNQAGSWNAVTGTAHPAGGGRDITYREQRPTTNFSSLRIYRSSTSFTDYVPGGRGGAMNLDPHVVNESASPLAPPSTLPSDGWRTEWQIDAEELRIVQDVLVVGDQLDRAAIYHTVEIRNLGTSPALVGWRNLHDWSLSGGAAGFVDGPANELEGRCGDSRLGQTRDEFSLRPVSAGLVRVALPGAASDYEPVLSLGFDPGFVPLLPVTVPDEYAYVSWGRASSTAFDDSIAGLTDLDDSAGLSWFGRDAGSARSIGGGESVRFTQVLLAFEDDSCPISATCAEVPWGLVGWWPFDEEDQGRSGTFDDIARGHEGVARFAPASVFGKVDRAARFDGNLDEIAVQDAPDLNLPAGVDLSIDFWIRSDSSGRHTVLEKRTAEPSVLGYQIWLIGGEIGLQLAEGAGSNICSSDPATSACTNYGSQEFIADGAWHLVAVTVDRDQTDGGIWYIDGQEVRRFDPTRRAGSLVNDAQLLIGAGDPDAPFAPDPLRGELDELEIARRVLAPEEVEAIYEAGHNGKCSASLDVLWDNYVCQNQTRSDVQLTVCNSGGRDAQFTFDAAGLPANPPELPGKGCDVQGPTQFELLGAEPLEVSAGQCATALLRVKGLANHPVNRGSCFQVTATDLVSGLGRIDYGSIRKNSSICCFAERPVTPIRPDPAPPSSVVFEIVDTGFGAPDLDVEVEPSQPNADAPPGLILADAAPGESITRTVSFGPDGVGRLEVPVSLSDDFTPLVPFDVLLSADLDGDAVVEPLVSATVLPTTEPCVEGLNGLCLTEERFQVEARWRTAQGEQGTAQAVRLTSDTGFFWFFSDTNLELVVKVLDACDFFDRFWVFAGGLTDVEVELTVTDLLTGEARTYFNPLGEAFEPVQDTNAFATCSAGAASSEPADVHAAVDAMQVPFKVERLPLNDDRFLVEAEWRTGTGESGRGEGVALTSDTGYFWFFSETNVELAVKVLDACGFNQRFWVFAAGLTDVEVRLTVTDTETGESTMYTNSLGTAFEPILDTDAFATCP